MAEEDAQLCDAIEAYIDETYMNEILSTLQEGGMSALEEEIAEDVSQWCMGNSEESARRRTDAQQEDQSWHESETIEHGSADYVELIKYRFETNQGERRRSDTPEISSEMWMQCAGYAIGIAKVISHLHQHGAADIMIANLRGSAEERVEACGAIVNSVNYHLRQNEIPGMQVMPQEDGSEMIVVMDESLLTTMQGILGPSAMAMITGNLALQLAEFMFYMCHSYEALALR